MRAARSGVRQQDGLGWEGRPHGARHDGGKPARSSRLGPSGHASCVHSRRMTVGIMGLGYVGLPLAVAFAEQGYEIVAVDVDARKIEALARGDSYIEDIDSERLRAVAPRIEATTRA